MDGEFFFLYTYNIICDDSSLVVLIWQKLLTEGFPQLSNLKTLIIADRDFYTHDNTCLLAATHVISACPRLQIFILVYIFSKIACIITLWVYCRKNYKVWSIPQLSNITNYVLALTLISIIPLIQI